MCKSPQSLMLLLPPLHIYPSSPHPRADPWLKCHLLSHFFKHMLCNLLFDTLQLIVVPHCATMCNGRDANGKTEAHICFRQERSQENNTFRNSSCLLSICKAMGDTSLSLGIRAHCASCWINSEKNHPTLLQRHQELPFQKEAIS